MKIKIKKIIAIILTFMMIFTQVPVNVFATELEVSNNDKVSNTEKSTLKGSYGILKQSKNLLSVFTLKDNNYLNSNANTESEQTFRVILPDEQIGYTLTVDNSEVEYGGSCTLTFALKEGYVKTDGFRIYSNGNRINPNDDGKNKYTIKNIQNDITITVTGVNDNTSPDVRITIGDNTWKSFKGVISYGKYFFNKKQNATITAIDRSGINKCYYAIDATGNDFNRPTVTNSELDKTLNWIELEGNSISLSEYDHCIIFVKAIDKCGNRTFIVTDGLTLDSTAPQVLGIESNQIYTKSKSFTVVEDNLATVKVDGQTVEPTNGKYTLVPKDGTYTIEVKDKAGNKITLNNITVNWDEVEIPTVESKVYTGQTLTANISENNLYTVTENKGGNDVGKYKVQLELKDPTNYKWRNGDSTAIATIEFKIVKAQREAPTSVTATGTTYKGGTDGKLNNVDSSMEYKKDGENEWHSITGDTVEGLSTGKYYVRYKDSKNYYASSEKDVYIANGQEIKVNVPASQVGYTLSVSNTVVDYNESSTLTFKLNKGYSKTKDFAVKVNGETVQLDNNNQYTIKNIQKDTNITVEGVADITAPDTEIKVSNKTWKSILNKITFGLFFKETQKAEITATDEGSGVNKYYYYVDKSGSEKSLTEKQLQAVDWKEGESVTFSEDSNYVIYAKVTDKAGNIKYVSTDGIVIDTIAPQVSGVESNQTYTKTQTFTVTDNNLDTVKVDGKTVESTNGSYTLVPKKGTYTIEVTDKTGNKTTLNKITVNWEKVKKPTVESKVYTGQTLTANISENGLYTVKENNGGIDVNEYDVQLTLKDPTNYRWEDGTVDTTVKFNITKATPVVTKPTTKTLTYNGSEQELVNAASTNGGTVKYSIDNKNWSTSIPTGKAAKEYTVYYKVEGNKNFKDVDVKEITNKINPRTIDLNWNKELTYNGKEQLPTATVSNLADGDKCEITVDGAQHKNAGTYEAKATKVSNPNYKLPENVTTSYTIKPKDVTVTITPNGGTYGEKITGATAKLNDVENGDHPEVTLTYTGTGYDGTEVNGTEVPSHAGKYTVTASINDKNYNLTGTNIAEFVVKGADAGLKVKEVNDKKYGDQGFKLEVSHKGNGKLSYSSSNEDVATVDDQGNVTIHNAGTTKLKVTLGVDHNYDSDNKEVTLTVNKINRELTVDQKDVEKTYGDEAFTIHAQSKDHESAIEYASSDEKVATVDSEGNVVIKGAGKVIITVSQKESKNYKKVSKEIKDACPVFAGAAVYAAVKNTAYSEGLWQEIDAFTGQLTSTTQMEDIKHQPVIFATREAYKRCGKDPGRYRPSAEALRRRLMRGIPLYQIDTLVDLINLVSLRTGHSIGGFDADKIQGTHLELGIGKAGEPFEGIGRGVLNIEGLPVYRDSFGGIGTPTSDHERTKMDLGTTHILAIVNGYNGKEGLQEAVEMIQTLLRNYTESDGGKIVFFE